MVYPECTSAQVNEKPYGVSTITSLQQYRRTANQNTFKKMIELRSLAPEIRYELRYADTNNFTHTRLYPAHLQKTFLRAPAAAALNNVQAELSKQGLGLKIFDAYRPYAVTVKFWELIRDERYVAKPTKASGHNRGLAVDLTIINLATGKPLDMGTDFDNFTDSASHQFPGFPADVNANRRLLKTVMLKHGFQLLETEWWHYSWPNDKGYEVLDIPINKLPTR